MPPKHKALLPSLMHEMEIFKDLFDWDLDSFSAFDTNNSISLYEDENKIYIEAFMPGVEPNEIQITFEKGILWMRAESKKEEKDVKYHMKAEKSYSYRLPIPSRVDEKAEPEATYKDGILKISFNKSKAEKAKKIEVKVK